MRTEIRSHTGLRGIAALLVVAYHQQFAGTYRLPFETSTDLFRRSYLMVDLFFILSGFVLSYVYQADKPMENIGTFFRARFARIYPLHFFALAVLTLWTVGTSALLSAAGKATASLGSFGDWFRQLILLNAWFPAKTEWNIPSWSISAEAFAYLVFPLAVLSYATKPRLMQAAVLTGSLLFYFLVGPSLDIVAGLAPLRCLAGFALGMLLFYHRDMAVRAVSLLQLAAAAWIIVALCKPIADPLIIPAFAALVFLTWRDLGVASRVLSTKPLHWLGEISYSVYLMHVPIGAVTWFLWVRIEPKLGLAPYLSRTLFLCLVFGAVIGVSALTFRLIEKPCQRAILARRRLPAKEAKAVAAP